MSQWSKWYLVPEKDKSGEKKPRIKRYAIGAGKRSWQRYPASSYAGLPDQELEALLRRLNATYEVDRKAAEERYNFDHAFVNTEVLRKFEEHLDARAQDRDHKGFVLYMLKAYVLEFFVIECQIPDPSRWHLKEDAWGRWLQGKELSPSTLKKVVSTANRFNKFLVNKIYPEMTAPRKLEPIGKPVLDSLRRPKRRGGYIKPDVYKQLREHVLITDADVLPNIELCYYFGLRISETLGLTRDKFLKDSLLVDEQGDRVVLGSVTRKTVKTESRRVPYWNLSAKEAWLLVQQIKTMHPDTLVKRVNACLERFNLTSHDFRRTFITNALRRFHWKDVKRAAGHTDVRTTMGYDQDDRELSEEKADLD